ncbi:hypothetical protein MPSEU_000873300 [Mayamaea pseudoterrestris]|nr:hypothetical protein MPSEU_000873300 [Mayamaea pseudoterrestris]
MIGLIFRPFAVAFTAFAVSRSHLFHGSSSSKFRHPSNLPMSTSALQAATTTTWFIDGNNLLASRGVPKDLNVVQERLGCIETLQSDATIQVMLVMDGPKNRQLAEAAESVSEMKQENDESTPVKTHSVGSCVRIQLPPGQSADDYIYESVAVRSLSNGNALQIVTADGELRRRVSSMVKNVVHPSKFWKTYLPRLAGEKRL